MIRFDAYDTGGFYDEMFLPSSQPRSGARLLEQKIESLSDGELLQRQQAAERALLHMGITFNVYGDSAGAERIFPFDIIPRIVEAKEWEWIERGLKQRVYALNLFIDDIYHEQKILKDKVIPEGLIHSARSFRRRVSDSILRAVSGATSPARIWSVTVTDKFMSWKTTCAVHLACRTSWKTGRS